MLEFNCEDMRHKGTTLCLSSQLIRCCLITGNRNKDEYTSTVHLDCNRQLVYKVQQVKDDVKYIVADIYI